MIFKEFFPSQTKNRMKKNPKYDSIINDDLKLMDKIYQSMHEYIQETYPYLSLKESIATMMNTGKQEKEGFVEYMERFKQEKSIIKILI